MTSTSSPSATAITRDVLRIDAAAECSRLEHEIREVVFRQLKRRGAIVAVSGGIDSSVVAFLCARALGKDRVTALFLPEADSSSDSVRLGQAVADVLDIRSYTENITGLLTSMRCYERRDEALRTVVPEFGPGCKFKITLPNLLDSAQYSVFSAVVQSPDGESRRVRLSVEAYLGILAATNFKQRARKIFEYYYADRFQYAVAGTPNLLEYDQGFFVKNGDGAADFKPIAHLYKTQVYQLAEYLGVPAEVQSRPSTTDTYSLPQSQEEFYFAVSLEKMDLCLFGKNHGIPANDVAGAAGLTEQQVSRMYDVINSKRRATRYLHAPAVLFGSISGLDPSQP